MEVNHEARFEICKTCDNLKPLIEHGNILQQCKICSCIMVFKTKIPSATCPIGKW